MIAAPNDIGGSLGGVVGNGQGRPNCEEVVRAGVADKAGGIGAPSLAMTSRTSSRVDVGMTAAASRVSLWPIRLFRHLTNFLIARTLVLDASLASFDTFWAMSSSSGKQLP